jgi:copper homeostasis protein (lipoprotein)
MLFRFATASIIACAALTLPACRKVEAPAAEKPTEPLFKPIDPALVTDALATPGLVRFWGVLPCADCAGIRTELQLVQDPKTGEPQTYELTETHLTDNTEAKPNITRGKWTIQRGIPEDANATMFVLDGGGRPALSRRFERINDAELRQLDREGKRIVSKNNHALTRVSQTIAFTELPPATGASAAPPPPAGSLASGPLPAAMVTDMASGWPINLKVGQEMTARLTADPAGRWSLRSGSDGGVIAVEGQPATERPAGQPAVEVFRLKATKAGKTTVTFDFKKGSNPSAAKSVSYPVTVQ